MTDADKLDLIAWKLIQIDRQLENIMSGLTDLQTAVTNLTAEVTTILADIQTALANDDPDAAVEAASQVVNTAITNLQAGDPLTGTSSTTPPATS